MRRAFIQWRSRGAGARAANDPSLKAPLPGVRLSQNGPPKPFRRFLVDYIPGVGGYLPWASFEVEDKRGVGRD